jgi:uncharacterized protein (TIGR02145 family)
MLILIITANCGLFEPEKGPGSLQIVLVKQEETGLEKSDETLGSVQCTVKKGTETKFDGSLTKEGSSFHSEVTDLEPGSDYSVLLYGKNGGGEIVARGYQSGINVNAGKATTVQISWNAFKPTLSAPANGSTSNNNKPAFSWSSLSNATAYELMVDNNSNFASPEIDQTSLTTAGYTPTSSLTDGTNYWKVRCKDSLGNWGGWSEAWSFVVTTQGPNAPTLVSPANGSTTSSNKPAFDWSDVSGAAAYELIVDNSSGFGSPEIDQTSLTASNFTATSSLADGTYYWKVRCKDSIGNWGAWSGAWTVIIGTTGPNPPTLVSPSDGSATNNSTPSFDWSDVSGAVAYELIVDNSSGFGSPEIDQTSLTVSNHTTTASLFDGTYYWKVRCKDSIGNWGAWSGVWSLAIITVGPSAPTLVSPADGSTTNDNTPAFDWSDVSGAAAYELIVDNSSGFGSPEIDQTSLTASNYIATSSLADGTYYWKVRCKDNVGNWGAWSGVWSFTIKNVGPNAPTLVSPSDASTTNNSIPSFDWSDVSGAVVYELIVDNSSGFGSPEIDQTNLTVSNYTATSSLADGTYYWKVRCKDNVGNWGGWSGVWSFTITTNATGTVTDIDGNTYKTIRIGNQWWMAENLKVTRYRNGDPITNVTNVTDWNKLTIGAYSNYNNDINNVTTYGRLYNWYAVNDSRNIAPAGWHVPSDSEWKILEIYLGMSKSNADATGWRGTDEGGKMKETGTAHWNSSNVGATNESGFSALPGGSRVYEGEFYWMGTYSHYWSSSEYEPDPKHAGWYRALHCDHPDIFRYYELKYDGYAIRCVKD